MTMNLICLLTLLLTCDQLLAQEEVAIPTVTPAEHFYRAAGIGVQIEFAVEKPQLTTADWFPLTLTISKVLNPEDVLIPDLAKIPDFHQRFEFKTIDHRARRSDGNRAIITYLARAKNAEVTEVPGLLFRYYNPRTETGDLNIDFPTTRSRSLPLEVRPIERPPPPIEPLTIPPLCESFSSGSSVLHPQDPLKGWLRLLPLLLLLPPVIAVGWVILWRAIFPDQARLARKKQSRAAKQALRELAGISALKPEGTTQVVNLLLRYLHERFALPSWRVFPKELSEWLPDRISPEHLADLEAILHELDARRFGVEPEGVDRPFLQRVRDVILHLEETPS